MSDPPSPVKEYRYLRVMNPDPQEGLERTQAPGEPERTQDDSDTEESHSARSSHYTVSGEGDWTELRNLHSPEAQPLPLTANQTRNPISALVDSIKALHLRTKFNSWAKARRFDGWRMGVLAGFCTAVFVCLANVVILIAGAAVSGGFSRGIAHLVRGSAEYVTSWSTAFHILVNILSTLLLSASNYTMQVLSSPTREEVDKVHSEGNYLDIGILSTRNLRHISTKRSILWCILGISSIPLHIFYNSAVFDVVVGNQFDTTVVEYMSPEYTFLNISAAQNVSAKHQNLTNGQWRSSYGSSYVSGLGDLFLVADEISLDLQTYYSVINNTYSTNTSNSLNNIEFFDHTNRTEVIDKDSTSFTVPGLSAEGWIPASVLQSDQHYPIHIRYAFAETRGGANSRLEISLFFMLIVIVSNIVKAIAMLLVLLDERPLYLVTLGDAAASFLGRPDAVTKGLCSLSKDDMLINLGGQIKMSVLVSEEKVAKLDSRLNGIWKPRKRMYGEAISDGRQLFGMSICLFMIVAGMIIVFISTGDDGGLGSWGTSSTTTLSIGAGRFDTIGTLYNAGLANCSQLLFSIGYLTFNGLFTCIANAIEWDNLALSRKGLRVTKPEGQQRSTYFLQLPFRYAIPLTAVSCLVHWLMSQSLFLVRIDVQDKDGILVTSSGSKSACGFSRLSFLVLSITFTLLFCLILAMSLRRWRINIPLAASCSLVISAACHPRSDEVDPHLKAVQWGLIAEGAIDGIEHCALSTNAVKKPQYGKQYR
ncbi:hypothetical protein BU16DRAFT_337514 [Lophium mytilinum]|uniref:DUF6536 domain-containing protein n=1 Tax=Lophium mytilinum TaxID=390894 RepID=A0A6A6QW06_9PEZI|nr:hypothetical protein BU16DRAFT_337514 [Lophium mytilinum]